METSAKQKQSTLVFHSLSPEVLYQELRTDVVKGLTSDEAHHRLLEDGPNLLPAAKSKSMWEMLWAQINSVLIYVLLIGAALSFGFNHLADGIVILCVIVVNVFVGYYMEGKAANTTKKLMSMMSPNALVLRDEERKQITSDQVVVGDIFFLQPGDVVPADGRVLACTDLQVLEAALTGESHPIIKTASAMTLDDVPLAERFCMVYSGTQVLKGSATCLAVQIGSQCEIGRISGLLQEVEDLKTPLVIQLEKFGGYLSIAIVLIAIVALGAALGRSYSIDEAFSFAIGIAVAAIPEGLPSCVTITFAIGVYNMAQKRAIVKSLPAVETLGSVSVICSDKTGTLTVNIMTVKALCSSSLGIYEVDDHGYASNENEGPLPSVMSCVFAGVFCNDSSLILSNAAISPLSADDMENGDKEEDLFTVQGDPTESCLLSLAAKNYPPVEVKEWTKKYTRIAEVPFDSATKFMATMHIFPLEQFRQWLPNTTITSADGSDSVTVICVKGAPEKILSFCVSSTGATQEAWLGKAAKLASRGMRVLGLAYTVVAKDTNLADFMSNNPTNFIMLSLAGIMDPPRTEAIAAVKSAQQAGITVKMITGDHPITATAIGKMLGLHLPNNSSAITGADLDRMASDQDEFDQTVLANDIFARTTPEHKLRIVQSLQRQNRILAFVLPTNGGQAFSIIMALIIGIDVPITALQILWVNMVTSITLGLVLAFEPPHDEIMTFSPRRSGKAIFGRFLSWRVLFVSVVLVCIVLGNFQWEKRRISDIKELRTIAVNTLSAGQVGYLFNCRFLRSNATIYSILTGNYIIYVGIFFVAAFQAVFTYASPFQYLFATAALDGEAWGKIIMWGVIVFFVVEIEKVLAQWKASTCSKRSDYLPTAVTQIVLEEEEKGFEEL
eukprot:gene4091-4477_t